MPSLECCHTLWKFHVDPKNDGFEIEVSFQMKGFGVSIFIFMAVYLTSHLGCVRVGASTDQRLQRIDHENQKLLGSSCWATPLR